MIKGASVSRTWSRARENAWLLAQRSARHSSGVMLAGRGVSLWVAAPRFRGLRIGL